MVFFKFVFLFYTGTEGKDYMKKRGEEGNLEVKERMEYKYIQWWEKNS